MGCAGTKGRSSTFLIPHIEERGLLDLSQDREQPKRGPHRVGGERGGHLPGRRQPKACRCCRWSKTSLDSTTAARIRQGRRSPPRASADSDTTRFPRRPRRAAYHCCLASCRSGQAGLGTQRRRMDAAPSALSPAAGGHPTPRPAHARGHGVPSDPPVDAREARRDLGPPGCHPRCGGGGVAGTAARLSRRRGGREGTQAVLLAEGGARSQFWTRWPWPRRGPWPQTAPPGLPGHLPRLRDDAGGLRLPHHPRYRSPPNRTIRWPGPSLSSRAVDGRFTPCWGCPQLPPNSLRQAAAVHIWLSHVLLYGL